MRILFFLYDFPKIIRKREYVKIIVIILRSEGGRNVGTANQEAQLSEVSFANTATHSPCSTHALGMVAAWFQSVFNFGMNKTI